MGDFAQRLVDRRAWVAAAWLAIAAALLPYAPDAQEVLEVGAASSSSEAQWVEDALAREFSAPFSRYTVLVATGIPAPDAGPGQLALREIAEAVENVPFVTRTLSYLDVRDAKFVGRRGTFILAGLSSRAGNAESTMQALRGASAAAQARLRERFPQAELMWTGGVAFEHDVRAASTREARTTELKVLPFMLVALLFVFGSVAAACIPVAMGALAVSLSLGAAAIVATYWPLTILLQNVVSMLGLGLGVDYALLMTSRFREALAGGAGPQDAAADAVRRAGRTIATSGVAVAIGFLALLAVPVAELRSIAVGGIVVVGISLALATTLTPAILAFLGHGIDWGRLRRGGPSAGMARWRRWGAVMVRRPGLVLLVAGAPAVLLGWQAHRFSAQIPSGIWLPQYSESTRGALALQAMGQGAALQTISVLVELPRDRALPDPQSWSALLRFGRELERDSRSGQVHTLPSLLGEEPPTRERLDLAPPDVLGSFLSRDGRIALVEIVPGEMLPPSRVMQQVRDLRRSGTGSAGFPEGTRVYVGGPLAFDVDYEDAVAGNTGRVIALVMAGSFVALFLAYRSLLVAVKALALNLVSVAAAMGAAVLVFQDGWGASLLGLPTPIDGLFPASPVLVFTLVFGLSIDYEIFLVARIVETVRSGAGDSEAIVEGLARTGPLITSAALVMIVVFVGFALGEFLIVKIIGFMLAAAIFIDATIIRLALGPALMRVGGRWNWWPGNARKSGRAA